VRVVLVRATDVPTYVQHGGADLGVAGLDTLLEHDGDGLYQAAGPAHRALPHERGRARRLRLRGAPCARARASAWPPSTRRRRAQHFAAKGVHVDLIKLYGSMELAPLTGLADAIVDLVSHRQHAASANHLVEVERIMDISLAPGGQPGVARSCKREPHARRSIDACEACGGGRARNAARDARAAPPATRPTPASRPSSSRVLHWSTRPTGAIEARVAQIIADVRARGDAAVLELTRALRRRAGCLDGRRSEIGRAELRAARLVAARAARARWRAAAQRVRAYHERQLEACGAQLELPRRRRHAAGPEGHAAGPRGHLRARRQGRLPVQRRS
jgi:ATP phosphoribosyltransferase